MLIGKDDLKTGIPKIIDNFSLSGLTLKECYKIAMNKAAPVLTMIK